MESYSALAASYDELTQDVGYEKRAAFVEKLFLRSHIPVHTVLDLACGTGTMTALLTERGYELIGVDGSEDMLLEAREKAQTLTGVPPLFLHQSMPELDLYGTVGIKTFALLLAHNQITAPQFIWLNIQKTIFLAFCQKNGFANSYLVTISARILLAVRVFLFIVLKSFQLITVASFSTNVSQMCESDTAIL